MSKGAKECSMTDDKNYTHWVWVREGRVYKLPCAAVSNNVYIEVAS